MMAIRAVVFDVGGVLKITPDTGRTYKWTVRLNLQPEDLYARLRSRGLDGIRGTCTPEAWLDGLREITGMDQAQTDEYMHDLWEEYLGTHNTELAAYFGSLRPRFQTAILSNSFLGAREKEQVAYGFEDLCDFIIYSHEVGFLKPDPQIFALTCERLRLLPSEVVFLDDIEPFVDAARGIGIHAILFKNNAQAISDIEACIQANA
jgi:epoxide hydrolase-like predicted phosphatase